MSKNTWEPTQLDRMHVFGGLVAECPVCFWRSLPVALKDQPNAVWHTRQEAAAMYRKHSVAHISAPTFIEVG